MRLLLPIAIAALPIIALGCEPPPADLERCSADVVDGACPAGRRCLDGACIVDLDPGDGIDDPSALDAELEAVWRAYDEGYAGFVIKPQLDWGVLRERTRVELQRVWTRFEASWAISRMVDALGDGHAVAMDLWRCSRSDFWGEPVSNVGACLTEVGGRLFVTRTTEGNASGFLPGDELLSIEGREVEELLWDLEMQPRCRLGASTGALRRARQVAGLMYRQPSDRRARVLRGGAPRDLALAPSAEMTSWLACDGRVGPLAPRVHPYGLVSAELPGDVLYVFLPAFGATDATGSFVTTPLIELLREILSDAAGRRGLILDLRGNGGGADDVYLALASWLYDEQTPLFACQFKEGPAHADLGPPRVRFAEPDPKLALRLPLAVLVNALSFSAADFTATFLQQTGRATLFGAPSGGGYGNAQQQQAGPSWRLIINNVLCADGSGRVLEGAPPAVDFPIDYRSDDLAAGRDTVIEAARAQLVAAGS